MGIPVLASAGAVCAFAPPAGASAELVLIPDVPTLIPLLIGFVVLIPLVNVLIVQPVFKVMDERAERIAGARRRAERLRAEADAVLRRYQEAVREVREEAERTRREQVDAARAEQARVTSAARDEAEHEIEQTRGELASALEQARAGLRASAEELARQAAERILGRTLS